MTKFDWSEQVATQVMKSWLATKGNGVSIAVLDTGADLTHPALQSLKTPGHQINVAAPGFDPALLQDFTNDNVADLHLQKGHGTQCATILSAAEEGGNALNGIVPKSEVFILKINTLDHKFFLVKDFLKGLEAAARLRVDLVICSISYAKEDVEDEGITPVEVERVFGLLRQSGALLLCSLPNKAPEGSWTNFAEKNFPNLRPEAVNVGAFSRPVFDQKKQEIDDQPGIHFLVSDAPGVFCGLQKKYEPGKISSSYGVYLAGAVGALFLAFQKKKLKDAYLPPSRQAFLKGLGRKFQRLGADGEWDDTRPVLFKTAAAV